nr:hypothetical protein [Amycolatopsis rubida]
MRVFRADRYDNGFGQPVEIVLGRCGSRCTPADEDSSAELVDRLLSYEVVGEILPVVGVFGQRLRRWFAGAAVQLGGTVDSEDFLRPWFASVEFAEFDDPARASGLELAGPLREARDQRKRNGGQLPDLAVVIDSVGGTLCPPCTVFAEQVASSGVEKLRCGDCSGEHRASVERGPLAVFGPPDFGGDQGVKVEMRVSRAAVPVFEDRHGDPVDVDLGLALVACAGEGEVLLDVGQGVPHRLPDKVRDQFAFLRRCQCPRDRHGFVGCEHHLVAGYRFPELALLLREPRLQRFRVDRAIGPGRFAIDLFLDFPTDLVSRRGVDRCADGAAVLAVVVLVRMRGVDTHEVESAVDGKTAAESCGAEGFGCGLAVGDHFVLDRVGVGMTAFAEERLHLGGFDLAGEPENLRTGAEPFACRVTVGEVVVTQQLAGVEPSVVACDRVGEVLMITRAQLPRADH